LFLSFQDFEIYEPSSNVAGQSPGTTLYVTLARTVVKPSRFHRLVADYWARECPISLTQMHVVRCDNNRLKARRANQATAARAIQLLF
jgi:hypothetical protein